MIPPDSRPPQPDRLARRDELAGAFLSIAEDLGHPVQPEDAMELAHQCVFGPPDVRITVLAHLNAILLEDGFARAAQEGRA